MKLDVETIAKAIAPRYAVAPGSAKVRHDARMENA